MQSSQWQWNIMSFIKVELLLDHIRLFLMKWVSVCLLLQSWEEEVKMFFFKSVNVKCRSWRRSSFILSDIFAAGWIICRLSTDPVAAEDDRCSSLNAVDSTWLQYLLYALWWTAFNTLEDFSCFIRTLHTKWILETSGALLYTGPEHLHALLLIQRRLI